MRKHQASKITVHFAKPEDVDWLQEQAGSFYAEQVRQRLNQSGLSAEQKIAVVKKIAELLENIKVPRQEYK